MKFPDFINSAGLIYKVYKFWKCGIADGVGK